MKVYVHYEESEDTEVHLTLKLTLPKKWLDQSTMKVLELFVESYNKKKPENTLDLSLVHMENSRGQKLTELDVVSDTMNDREDIYIRHGAPPEPDLQAKTSSKATEDEKNENEQRLRCKNYGCNEWYSEEDNSDQACRHHTAPPVFHDTKKGWSCCEKRVYDWDEFQKIEGCSTGPHSTVDPKLLFAASPTVTAANAAEAKNPGPVLKSIEDYNKKNPEAVTAASSAVKAMNAQEQKCTRREDGTASCLNKGCQKDFVVAENKADSCTYHRGSPVFHDTGKYWTCCAHKVKYDFDEFMKIPGCSVGFHQDGSGEFENPEPNA